MRKPEQKIFDLIKRNTPSGVNLDRVECRTPLGFPDVVWMGGVGPHYMGTIETKADVTHVLSEQKLFLRKAAKLGAAASLVAGYRGRLYVLDAAGVSLQDEILYDKARAEWLLTDICWGRFWQLVREPRRVDLYG